MPNSDQSPTLLYKLTEFKCFTAYMNERSWEMILLQKSWIGKVDVYSKN